MHANVKTDRQAIARRRGPIASGLLAAFLAAAAAPPGPEPARPAPDFQADGFGRDWARPGLDPLLPVLTRLLHEGRVEYDRTPAAQRVCWGGLIACAGLGLAVLAERTLRLRRRRIIPPDFTARFLDRLHEGKLDGGKALDYCEMNPSPAARVALAAVRRWGRPSMDLERAVALAHRVEVERLRRNVGTLRRIAVVAPLLGLIGTLSATSRLLSRMPDLGSGWGPSAAGALSFLTAGVSIAAVAIVLFDALSIRIERLSGALDRLGAETIDAIAMAVPSRSSSYLAANAGTARNLDAHTGHGGLPRPVMGSHGLETDAPRGESARP